MIQMYKLDVVQVYKLKKKLSKNGKSRGIKSINRQKGIFEEFLGGVYNEV